MAHTDGRLAASADFWIGTLAGSGLLDKPTVENLIKIRGRIQNNYFDDKPVLEELIQTIGRLRPKRR